MIKITVASYNNTPSGQLLTFTFDELGGTIGRADTNQLILPDPERSISRVHAQVVFRNGRFSLVDKGSNPVSVNGKALGNGTEATIQAGDQIQIGGYLLLVEPAAAAASMASAPSQAASPFGAPAPAQAPMPAPTATSGDPFAGFWSPPSTPPAASSPAAAPAQASASPGGIPTDWDPFASPLSAPPAAPAAAPGSSDPFGMFGAAPAPLGGGLAPSMAPASDSSLDSLFGLGAPSGADPFSQSPLGGGLGGPNTAADQDPLRALGQTRDAGQAAMRDQGSDLNTPFIAPRSSASVPVAAPMASPAPMGGGMMLPDDFDFLSPLTPAAAPAPAPSSFQPTTPAPLAPAAPPPVPASPSGAVVSWGEQGAADGRTVIKPKRTTEAATTPAASSSPNAPAFAPPAAPPAAPPVASPVATPASITVPEMPTPRPAAPAAGPVMAAPSTTASPHPADVKALLDAFKEGLATPTVQIDALTPEVMKLIGQLLHDSTQGTVDLLVARAALKREVRAEVTMIVAQKNNPLKFSPSVEVALAHLLSPPQRGFMPASQAMQDAYDDLRAHQFGFMAGMKAALDGVLKRFDPALLEGKLTQKSVLQSLLPATRKARMWEVFQELYAQISAEASDDFHELFGKEFLRAYEAHIDELHNDRHANRR